MQRHRANPAFSYGLQHPTTGGAREGIAIHRGTLLRTLECIWYEAQKLGSTTRPLGIVYHPGILFWPSSICEMCKTRSPHAGQHDSFHVVIDVLGMSYVNLCDSNSSRPQIFGDHDLHTVRSLPSRVLLQSPFRRLRRFASLRCILVYSRRRYYDFGETWNVGRGAVRWQCRTEPSYRGERGVSGTRRFELL